MMIIIIIIIMIKTYFQDHSLDYLETYRNK